MDRRVASPGLRTFAAFEIRVLPSPDTNDHEVRFFADGDDLIRRLWGDMLGLDPDDILVRTSPLFATERPHHATIARCSCGVIDCGRVDVQVSRSADMVAWILEDPAGALRFPGDAYDAEVERAVTDTGWETPDRTAARIVRENVNAESLTRHELVFDWASGRIRDATLTISLQFGVGYQILLHLPWANELPHQIAATAVELLAQDPRRWSHVEWIPQLEVLGKPDIAGPGWRRSAC